jgi:hypothetical protein
MHTFGCLVFALQNEQSSGGKILHWSPCAQLGVNLGPSPSHAWKLYLVLNLHMGCVSSQFHCRFNDYFETVRHGGPDVNVSTIWQQLAGLITATQGPTMEFHDKFQSPIQHGPQNDAVPASSNVSAIPNNIFMDTFHKYDNNESIATAPGPPQLLKCLPKRMLCHPTSP